MSTESAAPHQLTYGRRPLRRWRRWAVISTSVVGAIAVIHWRVLILARFAHLYWQHRVASFEAPPGTVAYELDSDRSAMSTDDTVVASLPASRLRRQHDYGFRLTGVCDLGGAIDAVYAGFPWDRFSPPPSPAFTWPGSGETCIFCHDRSAACGRRIVHVSCGLRLYQGGLGNWWSATFALSADSWKPATLWSAEQLGPASAQSEVQLPTLGRGRLRIDVGHIVASDPSRFTIAVDIDGNRRTIQGQLADDGTVVLIDPTK